VNLSLLSSTLKQLSLTSNDALFFEGLIFIVLGLWLVAEIELWGVAQGGSRTGTVGGLGSRYYTKIKEDKPPPHHSSLGFILVSSGILLLLLYFL
jgi:hypothetical protein